MASWALPGMEPHGETVEDINASLDGKMALDEFIEKSKRTYTVVKQWYTAAHARSRYSLASSALPSREHAQHPPRRSRVPAGTTGSTEASCKPA